MNRVIIGFGDGFSPVGHQAITPTNDDVLSFRPFEKKNRRYMLIDNTLIFI